MAEIHMQDVLKGRAGFVQSDNKAAISMENIVPAAQKKEEQEKAERELAKNTKTEEVKTSTKKKTVKKGE